MVQKICRSEEGHRSRGHIKQFQKQPHQKPTQTMMLTYVNAAGFALPPLVIHNGKYHDSWRTHCPRAVMVRGSKKGYINKFMFAGYGKRLIYHLHAAGQLEILQHQHFDCCCFGCVTRSHKNSQKEYTDEWTLSSVLFSHKNKLLNKLELPPDWFKPISQYTKSDKEIGEEYPDKMHVMDKEKESSDGEIDKSNLSGI